MVYLALEVKKCHFQSATSVDSDSAGLLLQEMHRDEIRRNISSADKSTEWPAPRNPDCQVGE